MLCRYNEDTLNICMKEFIIFVFTDSSEIFSKLRSAGLNYNLFLLVAQILLKSFFKTKVCWFEL